MQRSYSGFQNDTDFSSQLVTLRENINKAYVKLLQLEPNNEVFDPVGSARKVITDFSYLTTPQDFEDKVDRKLDQELRQTHANYVARCIDVMIQVQQCVDGMASFIDRYDDEILLEEELGNELDLQFIEELSLSIGTLLGLVTELNERISGVARERVLICAFRWLPDLNTVDFESASLYFQSVSLATSSGDELAKLFSRFGFKLKFMRRCLDLVIERHIFKNGANTLIPIHKTVVYLMVYLLPDVLERDDTVVKKIIELFGEFVMIETSLTGKTHNLLIYWKTFKAAQRYLNTLDLSELSKRHQANIDKAMSRIDGYRHTSIHNVFKMLVSANKSISWLCLHAKLVKSKTEQPLKSMLKLAQFESLIRNKFMDKLDQQADLFDQDKKNCVKYGRMLKSMSLHDDDDDNQTLQWAEKLFESISQLTINDYLKAKKMEKTLIALIQNSQFEAPILVTIQALIKSLSDMYENSSIQNNIMINFDRKVTSYWLVSESDKLLSRELHELIKLDSNNVSLMTFFFTKSTNCLRQCQTEFKYNDTLMSSLELFLASQTSSFLAVIPVRIYELIRTLDAPSELDSCDDMLAEREKRHQLRKLIYKCGYLARSLLFLKIEGINTGELMTMGLRKEIYVDIQSAFDRFELGNELLQDLHKLDDELSSIKRKFHLIVRQLNIDGNNLFDDLLIEYIKWCVEVMESVDNVMDNILKFPQNKPVWPSKLLQQLTDCMLDADISKFGLVCKNNQIYLGIDSIRAVDRILIGDTKQLLAKKLKAKMRKSAANINDVVDNFIGKRSQLEMLEHLSVQLKHADIVKTDTLRKIVKRVNMKPVASAIIQLDCEYKAYCFIQNCERLESNIVESFQTFHQDVFVQSDNLNMILLLLALSENLPHHIHTTETFKTMARDTTFLNEMLCRVAKTELRSKTPSVKVQNYLKFMQERLQ